MEPEPLTSEKMCGSILPSPAFRHPLISFPLSPSPPLSALLHLSAQFPAKLCSFLSALVFICIQGSAWVGSLEQEKRTSWCGMLSLFIIYLVVKFLIRCSPHQIVKTYHANLLPRNRNYRLLMLPFRQDTRMAFSLHHLLLIPFLHSVHPHQAQLLLSHLPLLPPSHSPFLPLRQEVEKVEKEEKEEKERGREGKERKVVGRAEREWKDQREVEKEVKGKEAKEKVGGKANSL